MLLPLQFSRRAIAVLGALTITSIGACRAPASTNPAAQRPVSEAIRADISFIGNMRQEGRAVGSAGSNRAATYIVEQYRKLNLAGAFQGACGRGALCGDGFFQPFNRQNARNAKNIAAVIPGSDSSLRDEYIVIGAHYDHVGRSATLSLDPDKRDEIRPGADDNASGTAAVLDLARRFAARPARRSILLVHFDAEEVGLFGSELFVAAPPVARTKIKFMVNLDMVGRLRWGGLEIDKSTLMYDDPLLVAVVDSAGKSLNIRPSYTNRISGRSDHASFRPADISAISFFTGFHDDYHRVSDTVARLDIRGIGLVSDIAEATVRFVADRK